ncbi:hypothetical protein A2U01_0042392, partial [Trifolium medium]|nr:hypothetical protein [Trifolium medium]
MTPKKSTASDKKRKTDAITSQSSVYDATKFIRPEQAQRPNGEEEVSFVSMVRNAINEYLGHPSDLPSDELCDFSRRLARRNWNVQAITETLLREGCTLEYNASGNIPLRALQNDMTVFSQLLFLL